MAVVDLNLSSLSLETLPPALLQLAEAVNERITILHGLEVGPRYPYSDIIDWIWPPENGSPNYALPINNLLRIVQRMSKYFVDLSADYISNSYTNFPKTLAGAFKEASGDLGEQNVYCGETFTNDTIANFRSILVSTAEWLNRMVYVVPSKTYTTQHWDDRKDWEAADEESLSNETAPFDPPEYYQRTGSMVLELDEDKEQHYFNGEMIVDGGRREIDGYTGLIVDNKTPYDAVVLNYFVLPAVAETNWRTDTKWQWYQRHTTMCREPWSPVSWPDDVYPGGTFDATDYMVYAGGQWKTYTRYTFDRKLAADVDTGSNYQISGTSYDLWQNWTHEGTQNYVLNEETEEEGESQSSYWYADPENSIETHCHFWYGFGFCNNINEPYVTSIAAHTRDYVIPPMSSITEPTNINWHEFDTGYSRGSYDWDEDYNYTFSIRVVPVLDFTESVTTFNVL